MIILILWSAAFLVCRCSALSTSPRGSEQNSKLGWEGQDKAVVITIIFPALHPGRILSRCCGMWVTCEHAQMKSSNNWNQWIHFSFLICWANCVFQSWRAFYHHITKLKTLELHLTLILVSKLVSAVSAFATRSIHHIEKIRTSLSHTATNASCDLTVVMQFWINKCF